MTFRILLFVAAMWTSSAALAHPGEHADADEKLIPTNCEQLADTEQYTDDVSYPEIKALKASCDAKEKVASEPRTAPASQPKPN